MKSRRTKAGFLQHQLARRERQIVGVVYRLGQASVAELVANIPDPPTADSIRRTCHILVEKGVLKGHAISPRRKVYRPALAANRARRSALEGILETFFGGSSRMLVGTLVDLQRDNLTKEDIDRLTQMVDAAPKKKRDKT